jgi:hypothetical protein
MTAGAADVGWLAGILDGEGCIHLEPGWRVQVRIVNTDRRLIDKVVAVSADHGIAWRQHLYKRQSGLGTLPRHDLYLGAAAVVPLLRLLQPHLTAKADKCAAALDRLARRAPSSATSGYVAADDSAPAEELPRGDGA